MNSQNSNFQKKLDLIFSKEDVGGYDELLLKRYLDDDKKNSVVTFVKKDTGEEFFFKAIKPWADPRNLFDFKKGLLVSEVFKQAKVVNVAQTVKNGEHLGVYYLFQQKVADYPGISDDEFSKLDQATGLKIINAYKETNKKLSDFLTLKRESAYSLFPRAQVFEDNFYFLGSMTLFEKDLNDRGIIKGDKAYRLARKFLDQSKDFFEPDTFSLLHGDFAPHNVIVADEIYIIDWERSFVSLNKMVGEYFDLADFYISAFQNKPIQKLIYVESQAFKFCLLYQLLFKMNIIRMFFNTKKNQDKMAWMIRVYSQLKVELRNEYKD